MCKSYGPFKQPAPVIMLIIADDIQVLSLFSPPDKGQREEMV